MEINHDVECFIKDYSKALLDENAALFAGAGLSKGSGMVNWSELLKDVAQELELENETDLISLAQYYENHKGNKTALAQVIIENFMEDAEINENHCIIASYPLSTVWTTNYDKLLEESLDDANKIVDIKRRNEDFSLIKTKRDVILYKMHGDIDEPSKCVITKNDYETYNDKHLVYATALKGELVSKTFLFIGFSFDDPNLNYILSRIKILMGEYVKIHYCFFRNIKESECKDNKDFKYKERKQRLRIIDLKRYGIQAILVDEYKDITEILKLIQKKIYINRIFISGAAKCFLPFEEEEAQKFIKSLTERLVADGNTIVSGYGLGVGSSVIEGALQGITSDRFKKLDDYLKLYPFPQQVAGTNEWTKYRKMVIKETGIEIFIFGNKEVNSAFVNSDGMWEEYEIAKGNDNFIIPVGCTGYETKIIYDKLMIEYKPFFDENTCMEELFKKLGEKVKDLEELVPVIRKIVKKFKQII